RQAVRLGNGHARERLVVHERTAGRERALRVLLLAQPLQAVLHDLAGLVPLGHRGIDDVLLRVVRETGTEAAQERHAREALFEVLRVRRLRVVHRVVARAALVERRRAPRTVGILVAAEPTQSVEHRLLRALSRATATLLAAAAETA